MTVTDWNTTTQTIGINGHPAAGHLTDTPELVNYDRTRGYPWQPWDAMPQRFIPGASSIGTAIGEDWTRYTRRTACRVAARMRAELADYTRADDAERALYAAAEHEQRQPMRDGCTVHMYTAIEDAARPQTLELTDHQNAQVDAWRAFKHRNNIRIGWIERTGYAPNLGAGAAGTIDRGIAYTDPDDGVERLAVVDLKTKTQPLSRVQPRLKDLVQIVALAHSTHLAIEESHQIVELPPIHRGVIVYLSRDGYRAHWIDPRTPDTVQLVIACINAAALKQRVAIGAFGRSEVHRTTGPASGPTLIAAPKDDQ